MIPIEGSPVDLLTMPRGCSFCPRCPNAMKVCLEREADTIETEPGHRVSCWMVVKEMVEKGEAALVPEEEAKEIDNRG